MIFIFDTIYINIHNYKFKVGLDGAVVSKIIIVRGLNQKVASSNPGKLNKINKIVHLKRNYNIRYIKIVKTK